MKAKEVNRIFTAKVEGLLAQGYHFNPQTMGSSQGEVASVDLTNGTDLIRVLMRGSLGYGSGVSEYLTIVVAKATTPVEADSLEPFAGILWSHELEVLEEVRFAKVAEGWYIPAEEAAAVGEKRLARHANRPAQKKSEELGEAYKAIALRWVRRQPKLKTAKLADIAKLTKVTGPHGRYYTLEVKGTRLLLR